MKQSSNNNFAAIPDNAGSYSICRIAGIKNRYQIGFISEDGEFYFDTNNEQVLVHPEDFQELFALINETVNAMAAGQTAKWFNDEPHNNQKRRWFTTKDAADDYSESLKALWPEGLGQVYGRFAGKQSPTGEWWEVSYK